MNESEIRVGEKAQQVKVPAAQAQKPEFNPRADMEMRGESQLHKITL